VRARAEIRRIVPATVGLLVAGALAGCSNSPQAGGTAAEAAAALPQGSETVELKPADFTVEITNPWWPMEVGDRWVYEETEDPSGPQRNEVTVLDETKRTASGIEARVVHDVVKAPDGSVVEDTRDLYAQDSDGNVWYVGEQTAEYENGKVVTTEGSWEAGVDGAQPGVLLPADPRPGTGYRQEYLKGEAEDQGFVLSTAEQVQVPTGMYQGTLMTRDTTPLEPDQVELKFYAKGVGPVLTVPISGAVGREALVQTNRTG
jgi:hypothetical protein